MLVMNRAFANLISEQKYLITPGTFDALIPMLPDHVSYLAIDLPGHGLSSRYPDGMIYSHIDYLYTLVLICKKFQWDKVSLLAVSIKHS